MGKIAETWSWRSVAPSARLAGGGGALTGIAAIALVVALALPAAASAEWSASRFSGDFSVGGGPEDNTMTISIGRPSVRDTTATRGAPGLSCVLDGPDGMDCGPYLIGRVAIDLGAGDDRALVSGTSADDRPDLINLGPGRDLLINDNSRAVIIANDGEPDVIVCRTGARVIAADPEDRISHTCDYPIDPQLAGPRTAVVTSTADTVDHDCDASCTLRDALWVVQQSTGGGTVVLPAGTFDIPGGIPLTKPMTIQGAGARKTIIRNPAGNSVVDAGYGRPNQTYELSDVTLDGGACGSFCDDPVLRVGTGRLNANRITVTGRHPISVADDTRHGGILDLRDSTVTATGGVAIDNGSTVGLTNVTVGGDVVSRGEVALSHVTLVGGVEVVGVGRVVVRGSVVTGVCLGVVGSVGANVWVDSSCGLGVGDVRGDPQLSVLMDNGGPTDTREPAQPSPAIDRNVTCVGATGTVVVADARGWPRPFGGGCDSGAVERQPRPLDPPVAPVVPGPGLPGPGLVVDSVRPSVGVVRASVRRGSYARLRSLALRVRLSEPARVKVSLRRSVGGVVIRSTAVRLQAGAQRFVVGAALLRKSLKKRSYVLTVTATDAAGNVSRSQHLTIRLR